MLPARLPMQVLRLCPMPSKAIGSRSLSLWVSLGRCSPEWTSLSRKCCSELSGSPRERREQNLDHRLALRLSNEEAAGSILASNSSRKEVAVRQHAFSSMQSSSFVAAAGRPHRSAACVRQSRCGSKRCGMSAVVTASAASACLLVCTCVRGGARIVALVNLRQRVSALRMDELVEAAAESVRRLHIAHALTISDAKQGCLCLHTPTLHSLDAGKHRNTGREAYGRADSFIARGETHLGPRYPARRKGMAIRNDVTFAQS